MEDTVSTLSNSPQSGLIPGFLSQKPHKSMEACFLQASVSFLLVRVWIHDAWCVCIRSVNLNLCLIFFFKKLSLGLEFTGLARLAGQRVLGSP